MKQESCKRCFYFDGDTDTGPLKADGFCRYYPPATKYNALDRWPGVQYHDWCGFFQGAPEPKRAEK
jgi:hypothetical protein